MRETVLKETKKKNTLKIIQRCLEVRTSMIGLAYHKYYRVVNI